MESIYNRTYFEDLREEAVAASSVIVPILMKNIAPSSVVDLGCGGGHWLSAFRANGVTRLVGVDRHWVPECLREKGFLFYEHDLCEPIHLSETFDLVICLEVAEHLPCESSDTLVTSLCKLSDTILFSAACPSQGGIGHVNEQPLHYWAELFRRYGFFCADVLRYLIWSSIEIPWWYRQNIVFFARRPMFILEKFLPMLISCLISDWPIDIIHPACRELSDG